MSNDSSQEVSAGAAHLALICRSRYFHNTTISLGPTAGELLLSGADMLRKHAVLPVCLTSRLVAWSRGTRAPSLRCLPLSDHSCGTACLLRRSVPEAVLSEGGAGLVRYAWTADPCNWPALEACNVYSKSGGLPVPPFMLYVDGVAKPSGKATWPPTTTPRCVWSGGGGHRETGGRDSADVLMR